MVLVKSKVALTYGLFKFGEACLGWWGKQIPFQYTTLFKRESAGLFGATTVPIVQSSSFANETAEELEDIFRGRKAGHVYTRIDNHITRRWKTDRHAGGRIASIAIASGMSAITMAVMTIIRSGDEILASSSLSAAPFPRSATRPPTSVLLPASTIRLILSRMVVRWSSSIS
jgi:cystathionine beta-lyase/cystathionine gamma-synthase